MNQERNNSFIFMNHDDSRQRSIIIISASLLLFFRRVIILGRKSCSSVLFTDADDIDEVVQVQSPSSSVGRWRFENTAHRPPTHTPTGFSLCIASVTCVRNVKCHDGSFTRPSARPPIRPPPRLPARPPTRAAAHLRPIVSVRRRQRHSWKEKSRQTDWRST